MVLQNILYFLFLFLLLLMAVTALYHIVLFVSYDFNIHYLEIDTCIDQGGRWDHHTNECNISD